jgi:hypothetical protein
MDKMTTPNKTQILERARELYTQNCYRNGCPELANTNPEDSELLESGFIAVAKSDLMHNVATKNIEWKNYNENLENSYNLKIDLEEAMKSGVVVSGITGTGKSDLAMYLVDRLMKAGVLVVVFDSSQDWLNRSSIAQYQTLAIPRIDKIPEDSIIFDISRLSVTERQGLIESFSETLYRCRVMNPSQKQVFLVFEEGSSYFREGFMRSKRFDNATMLMSEGRNYGVRFMVITQFFASLDKMCMRYMRQRYFGSTNEPRDVEYITRFFSKEQKQEIGKTLRSLEAGSFLYMNGSEAKRVHIEPYETTTQKQQIATPEIVKIPITSTHSDAAEIMRVLMFLGLFVVVMLIIGNMR